MDGDDEVVDQEAVAGIGDAFRWVGDARVSSSVGGRCVSPGHGADVMAATGDDGVLDGTGRSGWAVTHPPASNTATAASVAPDLPRLIFSAVRAPST